MYALVLLQLLTLGLTVDLNLRMLEGSMAGGKDGGQDHGHNPEGWQHCALHTAGWAERQSRQKQPLTLLPQFLAPCQEAKQPELEGFLRAHVKLELGGGSKLALSHRIKWWQLLWLASDIGRHPDGCQNLLLTARAQLHHVLGQQLVWRVVLLLF